MSFIKLEVAANDTLLVHSPLNSYLIIYIVVIYAVAIYLTAIDPINNA